MKRGKIINHENSGTVGDGDGLVGLGVVVGFVVGVEVGTGVRVDAGLSVGVGVLTMN
jgi:hypothetical protein